MRRAGALIYPGGKVRMASRIIECFPRHEKYVEPFGGAAAVLLHKPPAACEIYGDLDARMVNFFRVLRAPETRHQLTKAVAETEYSRANFVAARRPSEETVEDARRLVVRSRMGWGITGIFRDEDSFRGPDGARNWANVPRNLEIFGARFERVRIEHTCALTLMRVHDSRETLFYLDPPYVASTCSKNKRYALDLADDKHVEMLDIARSLCGNVVISGYSSAIYDEMLRDWREITIPVRGGFGAKQSREIEKLWCNFG